MIKQEDVIIALHNSGCTTTVAVEQFLTDAVNSGMAEKCYNSKTYCQHLYAAFCNTEWEKSPGVRLLISWRYAGRLVSILEQRDGNYLDWYCSGMGYSDSNLVNEGVITHKILQDMLNIGWSPIISE